MPHLSFFISKGNEMKRLEKLIAELISIAKSYQLDVSNFEIKWVNPIFLNELLINGYEKRPYFYKTHQNNEYFSPEVFVFGQPHTIYLNENNSFEMNLFSIAHAFGHVDFVNRHTLFKIIKRDFQHMKKTFDLYVSNLVQLEGEEVVKEWLRHLRLLISWSNVHEQIFINEQSLINQIVPFTIKNFNSNIIKVVLNRGEFPDWIKKLMHFVTIENQYFYTVKKTKLMNEGWAAFWQLKLLEKLQLTQKEKMEIALLTAKLHKKETNGINVYSLGKTLWEQVGEDERYDISSTYLDSLFVDRFYNEYVHSKEQISYLIKSYEFPVTNFKDVKKQLINAVLFSIPLIGVNQHITNKTGHLTINYINIPFPVSITYILELKKVLELILNEKVYIKPYFYDYRTNNVESCRK